MLDRSHFRAFLVHNVLVHSEPSLELTIFFHSSKVDDCITLNLVANVGSVYDRWINRAGWLTIRYNMFILAQICCAAVSWLARGPPLIGCCRSGGNWPVRKSWILCVTLMTCTPNTAAFMVTVPVSLEVNTASSCR